MPEKPWDHDLSDRERKEVAFAHLYATDEFNHGTPGSLSYLVIAKLADKLDRREVKAIVGELEGTIK